jgi:FlaA1/EpsC-like NDP-sugar epimerase
MSSLRNSVNARRAGQATVDAALVALAYYLAYVLRFDSGVPARYEDLLAETIVLVVPMKLVLFALFGLYSKLWRFFDQKDFESIVKAVIASSVVLIAVTFLLAPGSTDPPRGVVALDFLITLALLTGSRFLVRWAIERPSRGPLLERAAREVLIVGAGNGGQQVAFELRRNPELSSAPIGFIDDDPRKQGMRIAGLKVLGRTEDLPRVLDDAEPDEVLIAIPSAPGIVRQKVVTACRERAIPVRTLPTTF